MAIRRSIIGRTFGRPGNQASLGCPALLCIGLLAGLTACGGWSPVALKGLFNVESAVVSDDDLQIHDVVETEGTVVALASTAQERAGVILRSEDGGLNWSQVPIPLADALSSFDPGCGDDVPETGLIVAGSWIVALRSETYNVDACLFVRQQAVAVSPDLGLTWDLVDLPSAPGTQPLVSSAAESGGNLVLGGATLALTQLPEDPFDTDNIREAFDSALWVSSDPPNGFEPVAESQFAGLPGFQLFTELVNFDGRLFAVGRPVWESTDDGRTWSPTGELNAPSHDHFVYPPATVVEGRLRIGDEELEPGSSTWVPAPMPDEVYPRSEFVPLPDGATALTWNEDQACDCSAAFAGRLEGDHVVRSELNFDYCQDTAGRPSARVHQPGLIGDGIAALATCYEAGQQVASLAFSTDGGRVWDTSRLAEYAPDGTDLIIAGEYAEDAFVFVSEEGVLVALMSVTGSLSDPVQEPGQLSPAQPVAQVVALRISATG